MTAHREMPTNVHASLCVHQQGEGSWIASAVRQTTDNECCGQEKYPHGFETTTTTNLSIYRKPLLIMHFLGSLARFLSDSPLTCLALLGDELAICLDTHSTLCQCGGTRRIPAGIIHSRHGVATPASYSNAPTTISASRKNETDIASDSWGVVSVYRLVVVLASTETAVLPIAGLINNSLYTYLILWHLLSVAQSIDVYIQRSIIRQTIIHASDTSAFQVLGKVFRSISTGRIDEP